MLGLRSLLGAAEAIMHRSRSLLRVAILGPESCCNSLIRGGGGWAATGGATVEGERILPCYLCPTLQQLEGTELVFACANGVPPSRARDKRWIRHVICHEKQPAICEPWKKSRSDRSDQRQMNAIMEILKFVKCW